MNAFPVFTTELLKLKRSKITWILTAVYSVAPWMLGFMMALLKNPELGRRMGLLTAKAEMTIGTVDWPTFLTYSSFLFVGGMIVLAIVEAYVFGREYAESTAKNMLILPVGRGRFVGAKLAVSALWFVCMAVIVYAEALLVGFLIGLPGYDPGLLAANIRLAARLTVQVILVSSASAWISVVSRGYLAPVGFSILLLLIGDLFSHTGWGVWIPWSIVMLSAGAGGPLPGTASTVVLIAFFGVCAFVTYLTLDRSDNTQ